MNLSEGVYTKNEDYIVMLDVIGVSTTVEYMMKSVYEKAWYEFDYWSWVKKIWSEPEFFANNFIRKLERKLFVTLEFGFKTGYAKLIELGAKTTFEASDGQIYLTAKFNHANPLKLPDGVKRLAAAQNLQILSIPRWDPFTKILPQLTAQGLEINDISGNQFIVVSIVKSKDQTFDFNQAYPLFDSRMVTTPERERNAVLVSVNTLGSMLGYINKAGIQLEHIYDY
ncbi:MAG: hypothetical protein P8Y45_10990 [Exilibacterium sp.]